jgi:exodeoxyribonuclease V alpha subunit
MHFDIVDSSKETRKRVVKHFKKYYESEKVNSIMDIQVLAPVKERGDASVFNLNQDIQEYVNPCTGLKKEIIVSLAKDKVFVLREKDKVMCVKNNYKLYNTHGIKTDVFNGWVGILEEVNAYTELSIIYFPIIEDRVVFSFSDIRSFIILGYASTVHKYQGSSAKYVVGTIDGTTPPNMRTKELMYTMPTRAELDCTIVAQNSVLYSATLTSGIQDKNTFLQELLDNEERN